MTYKPKNTQERILHRLKIAEGHLKKVMDMVQKDEYCIDILNQSLAVQNAIKETDAIILENHLNTCVIRDIKEGKTDETIGEIMKVIKRSK
ncbi:MAG TPA: metal-sensing transcriptional repressor [Candidatus Saccharimonadales bacterium]|nr:metal-sensing transcriptional repressor [Candidatus Saccharimonadales bacterium]